MRTWRVGTFSMGASLLFLGVFLLLTNILRWDMTTVMISWWPVIFIILGVEVLLYIYFSKQESPYVKYDILSIFFIGIIGIVGIGLTLLQTTGLIEEAVQAMNTETRSLDLPKVEKSIGEEVKRVVVDTNGNGLSIETSPNKQMNLFGTYQVQMTKKEPLFKAATDYLLTETKGDTLYITFKNLPDYSHYDRVNSLSATLIVPQDIKLEVNASGSSLSLKPREFLSNWVVTAASDIDILTTEQANMAIDAQNIQELHGKNWNLYPGGAVVNEEVDSSRSWGTYTLGEGTQLIKIFDAYSVKVHTLPE